MQGVGGDITEAPLFFLVSILNTPLLISQSAGDFIGLQPENLVFDMRRKE